jgi:hypothetical protein
MLNILIYVYFNEKPNNTLFYFNIFSSINAQKTDMKLNLFGYKIPQNRKERSLKELVEVTKTNKKSF